MKNAAGKFFFIAILLLAQSVAVASSNKISYQGNLNDDGGMPVSGSVKTIRPQARVW